MKETKEKLKRFIPPICLDLFHEITSMLRFFRFSNKHLLKSNTELKDVARGKRAFLIATGPSLNLENLQLLRGEDCYSVSNFFLHKDLRVVAPKMHFFAPYHEPMDKKNYIDWLKMADQALPPETEIFLGHTVYPFVQEFSLFPDRKVRYLFLAPDAKVACDLARPLTAPQTGPIMVLPVLLYMGYSEIFLLGCDQTGFRDFKKQITNFYNCADDPRKNATLKEDWLDIISSHRLGLKACIQYHDFYKLATSRGINMINLSQDSWLDFFPKGLLSEVCSARQNGK